MNMSQYRAWRFYHPDKDAEGQFSGLGFSTTGGIQMVQEDASVRQAILLLVSTRPGERVMRPDYGCDLNRLVFSLNDDTTAGLAIHYLRQALDRWEPRIEILHLSADRNEADPRELDITLRYRVRTSQQEEAMTLSLNLSGE